MKSEPEIIKELREAEKLGILQGRVTSNIEELDTVEESSEDVSDETIGFIDNDVERNTGEDDTDYKKAEEPTFKTDVMWHLLNCPKNQKMTDYIANEGFDLGDKLYDIYCIYNPIYRG